MSSGCFVGSSSTLLPPFPLAGACPLLELRCQLLVGRERSVHATEETPDLLGECALPRSQEGISHGVPPCDHIAAGFEELRLSGIWLEASVTELLGNTLDALTQIAGIAPERCAVDAVLENRPSLPRIWSSSAVTTCPTLTVSASPPATSVNRSSASISSMRAVSMDSSEGRTSVIGEPLCVAMTASLVAVTVATRRACTVGRRLGSARARGVRRSACGYYRLRRTRARNNFQ